MSVVRFKSRYSNDRVATGAKTEQNAEGQKYRVPEPGLVFNPVTLHIDGKDTKVGLLVLDTDVPAEKAAVEKLRELLKTAPTLRKNIREISDGEWADYTLSKEDRHEVMEEAARIIAARRAGKEKSKEKGKGKGQPDDEPKG